MPFLMINQLGPDLCDEIDHDVLFESLAQDWVFCQQHFVPVLTTDEETLAVRLSLIEELGTHFEGDAEATNNTFVFVLDWKDFLFVYFETDCQFSFLNEVNFSKFIQLSVDKSAFLIKYWLEA